MRTRKTNWTLVLKIMAIVILALLAALIIFFFAGWPSKTKNVEYGMTLSRPYAYELKVDYDQILKYALDEMDIRRFRLPAYWSDLEPKQGEWQFANLDKDVNEINKRGGKVILAVGKKLPRWPECWMPDWYYKLSKPDQDVAALDYIKTVVERYKRSDAILAWQVENEPHFGYGFCPKMDNAFIKKETDFVRSLDSSHPIYTTDSGELSTWFTLGKYVDKLGVSVYRVVRNPALGNRNFKYFFLPPWFYERKALLARLFGVKGVYVSEFQMEPWSNKSLNETPIEDQLTSMDLKQMQENFAYAERMGIDNIDFWGLEWWTWMKDHGHPELLQAATEFYRAHQ
ncbi:MAG: beta-galactosidase [Patescibacteria group bacterium]